jgi:transposase-like protein
VDDDDLFDLKATMPRAYPKVCVRVRTEREEHMKKNETNDGAKQMAKPKPGKAGGEAFRKGKRGLDESLIDQWLAEHYAGPEDILGKEGLLARLTKAVVERALGAELTHHLGYAKGDAPVSEGDNCRNGTSAKTLIGEGGKVAIAVPRDREGTFAPRLIAKGQRRFEGFDEKIIAMYARGMTVREIQGLLLDQYQVEVGHDFISTVTDAVLGEVVEWQNRPLEGMYPIVFFDALRVKIRSEGTVKNQAVYLALGVAADGTRDVLGLWIEQTEGAKFWMKVMNELRNRGVGDILIAVVDGLKGFPEAITGVFPQTTVQTCIVHLTRFSLAYCSWQDRPAVANGLKAIYRAASAEEGARLLEAFGESELGKKYPMIAASWRRHWAEVIPFYDWSPEVRKMIYTTNAIESLNMQLRKVLKNRGHFPSEEAAGKLIYLALRNIVKQWKKPPTHWGAAAHQFALRFGERFISPPLAMEKR